LLKWIADEVKSFTRQTPSDHRFLTDRAQARNSWQPCKRIIDLAN